jgi:hypothetical protein
MGASRHSKLIKLPWRAQATGRLARATATQPNLRAAKKSATDYCMGKALTGILTNAISNEKDRRAPRAVDLRLVIATGRGRLQQAVAVCDLRRRPSISSRQATNPFRRCRCKRYPAVPPTHSRLSAGRPDGSGTLQRDPSNDNTRDRRTATVRKQGLVHLPFVHCSQIATSHIDGSSRSRSRVDVPPDANRDTRRGCWRRHQHTAHWPPPP